MKRLYTLFVILIVLNCFVPIALAQVGSGTDPHLMAAVRVLLDVRPGESIPWGELEVFYDPLYTGKIETLNGLEHATNLKRIDLRHNKIRDITAIVGLTNLKALGLTDNQISDISPLTRLTQLEALNMSRNRINDITPLTGLTQLKTLALEGNQISDISPLAGLIELKGLSITGNQFNDISPLAGLINLEELYLSNNQISDVSPLTELTQLKRLSIAYAQITDITPLAEALAGLKGLKGISLAHNQISDITPLTELTHLNELSLADNQISDIAPLAGLIHLEKLGLAYNQISDITPLTELTQLQGISFRCNQISDITSLTGLKDLKGLDLSNNQISNITPLVGLTALEWLDLGENQVPNSDRKHLRRLPDLTELRFGGDQLGLYTLEVSTIDDWQFTLAAFVVSQQYPYSCPVENPTQNQDMPSDQDIPSEGTSLQVPVVVEKDEVQLPPMFWVDSEAGTLHSLINTQVRHLLPNVQNATSLAVDVAAGKLYWTEKTSKTTGRIRRANFDGNPNVQLVKNLTSAPHGIALDAAAGKIYLTNAWGKVQRLNLDGSNFQPNLITELDMPKSLALDVSRGKVYWTEMPGRIRRANLDGSNVEDVAIGLGMPTNIAISENRVYWTEKTGEDTGEIRSANLRGNPNVMTRHTFPQGFPVGIAVDPVEEKLYWTTSGGNIGRSNLDSSNFQPDLVTGLNAPGTFVLNVETPVEVETPETLTTDAVVSISPSSVISPAIGEQLTLNLNITGGEAIAGYQATVAFDATALRYVESSNGDYLPTGASFDPLVVDGNHVAFAATTGTSVSKGDGTLVTVTFKVIAAKASMLTLSDVILSDSKGNSVSPQVAGGQVTEPPKPKGDVNADGVINIQDLVLVASHLGKTGPNTADVNGDEVVDIRDLVKVAGALGNAAAAPSLHPQALTMFTAADVQKWLSQAQYLDLTDITAQRGIRFLEQLLAALIPRDTILLSNYPNPFNPETWIPYQLAQDTDVQLLIYDTRGIIVRRLALGHQPAGYYTSPSRAAYWNGRNNLGERVASGVYFYQLLTNEVFSLRKMVILK